LQRLLDSVERGYGLNWSQLLIAPCQQTTGSADLSDKPPDGAVQEDLVMALESIQNYVQGEGGKVKPSVES
jgi:hypothetical protein